MSMQNKPVKLIACGKLRDNAASNYLKFKILTTSWTHLKRLKLCTIPSKTTFFFQNCFKKSSEIKNDQPGSPSILTIFTHFAIVQIDYREASIIKAVNVWNEILPKLQKLSSQLFKHKLKNIIYHFFYDLLQ